MKAEARGWFQRVGHSMVSPLQRELFSRTFEHPVLGALAEWVPTAWLADLANPTPSDTTDLGTWRPCEPLVGLDALFADLREKGMRDPLILGVGRVSRRVRLEAGNHRVRVLLAQGVEFVPAVAYVGDSAITRLENGEHEGREMELLLPRQSDIMGPYPIKEYRRLSEVLASPPALRHSSSEVDRYTTA